MPWRCEESTPSRWSLTKDRGRSLLIKITRASITERSPNLGDLKKFVVVVLSQYKVGAPVQVSYIHDPSGTSTPCICGFISLWNDPRRTLQWLGRERLMCGIREVLILWLAFHCSVYHWLELSGHTLLQERLTQVCLNCASRKLKKTSSSNHQLASAT